MNTEYKLITETEIQRISRYLVTGSHVYDKSSKTYIKKGEGYHLIKLINNNGKIKETVLQKDCLCTIFNDISNISHDKIRDMIYYEWYINQIYNVINKIVK